MNRSIIVNILLYGSALIAAIWVLVVASVTVLWVVTAPFIWIAERIHRIQVERRWTKLKARTLASPNDPYPGRRGASGW